MVEFLVVLAILALVAVFVTVPFRRASSGGGTDEDRDLAELRAARDAKYREIRDAELDHRTGKLSSDDFEELDRALRAEAVEILKAIDRTAGQGTGEGRPPH